jgi:hypothetical protein
MIKEAITSAEENLVELRDIVNNMGDRNEKKLKRKWDKRMAMDAEITTLTKDLDILNNTRNNLFTSINNDEKLLAEQLDEKKKIN